MESVDNHIRNFASFERIILPHGWEQKRPPTGRGDGFVRAFSPHYDDKIEIAIFFDGQTLRDETKQVFRTALNSIPRTIYDIEQRIGVVNEDVLAAQLCDAMGNAGQNQLTAAGMDWRVFHLESLSIVPVARTTAIHFTGYFHNEQGEPVSYYESFLFDGTPDDTDCRVHEVFFRAPTQQLFAAHKSDFDATMRSIQLKHTTF